LMEDAALTAANFADIQASDVVSAGSDRRHLFHSFASVAGIPHQDRFTDLMPGNLASRLPASLSTFLSRTGIDDVVELVYFHHFSKDYRCGFTERVGAAVRLDPNWGSGLSAKSPYRQVPR
jgi:hypothetical protein